MSVCKLKSVLKFKINRLSSFYLKRVKQPIFSSSFLKKNLI